MRFRRIAVVMSFGPLLGCQVLLGIDEGKPRDAGEGGASSSSSSSVSAGEGGASSASSSASTGQGGGSCAPLCKVGEGCAAGADCLSGVCTDKACDLKLLLLLATHKIMTSNEKLVLAASTDRSHPWKLDMIAGRSVSPPDVVITPQGHGVGLLRFTDINAVTQDNGIMFTTWTPTEGWKPFGFVSPALFTLADPALAASASTETVHATFLKREDKSQYYMTFDGAAWSPPGTLSASLFCTTSAGITANADEAAFAYADMGDQIYGQDKPKGTLLPIEGKTTFPPAIIKLLPGAPSDMTNSMVAFVQSGGLFYATRIGVKWSTPLQISGAQPDVTDTAKHRLLALVALPDGAAALAYRGTDGNPHVLKYTPAQAPPWSPLPLDAALNVPVDSPPSLAHGFAGDELELAYVSGGQLFHASYAGLAKNTWTAPVRVDTDGQYLNVVIASRSAP